MLVAARSCLFRAAAFLRSKLLRHRLAGAIPQSTWVRPVAGPPKSGCSWTRHELAPISDPLGRLRFAGPVRPASRRESETSSAAESRLRSARFASASNQAPSRELRRGICWLFLFRRLESPTPSAFRSARRGPHFCPPPAVL